MGRYQYMDMETEQESKSFEARVWWIFWIIALVVLLYTAYHHWRVSDLVHNGRCIEAEYSVYNGKELARYRDENNILYSYDLSGLNAIHGEDTVLLYYKDFVSTAEPRRAFTVWLWPYLFSTASLILFSWVLYRIYHRED
ncbi:MAG: hypothetical protein NC079_04730 [Clostridium sp.]|nr:hypothetical protein [Acetatifactor muris]MCM1526286.1 hypothetical protein [Bacteroides sp.]MCM1562897.1 hypothetical protein [Clostridium sp.]